jgi:hypothetical protein
LWWHVDPDYTRVSWAFELATVALVLTVPSIIPSLYLFRDLPEALLVAPLLTALAATVALVLAVLTNTVVWPWLLVVAALGNAAAMHKIAKRRSWARWSLTRSRYEFLVVGVAILPLFALSRATLGWDAHAIWMFHARWAFAGGKFYRSALRNRAFRFGHSDYPPLIPSTVGMVWKTIHGVDLRQGQMIVAVLNVSVVGLLGLALVRIAPQRFRRDGAVLGALLVFVSYVVAGKYVINGYADLLCAAAGAAAVVYALVLPRSTENLVVSVVLIAVCGLTKNEGVPLVMLFVVLVLLRYRRDLHRALVLTALVVGATAGWIVLARVLGAHEDQYQAGRIRDLVTGKIAVASRLSQISASLTPHIVLPLMVAAGCSVLGIATYRAARRSLGLGSSAYVWVVVGVSTLVLFAEYVISHYKIEYILRTTVDRTTMIIQLLLFFEIACWCLLHYIERETATEQPIRSNADTSESANTAAPN